MTADQQPSVCEPRQTPPLSSEMFDLYNRIVNHGKFDREEIHAAEYLLGAIKRRLEKSMPKANGTAQLKFVPATCAPTNRNLVASGSVCAKTRCVYIYKECLDKIGKADHGYILLCESPDGRVFIGFRKEYEIGKTYRLSAERGTGSIVHSATLSRAIFTALGKDAKADINRYMFLLSEAPTTDPNGHQMYEMSLVYNASTLTCNSNKRQPQTINP